MPPKKPTLEDLIAALSDKIDALTEKQEEHHNKIKKQIDGFKTEIKTL